MNKLLQGYTPGTGNSILDHARSMRFTGTVVLRAHPGWLISLVVTGESEQLTRLEKYPGLQVPGQHFLLYEHEAHLSPELPAIANWPMFPSTNEWDTEIIPWHFVQRNLGTFSGIVVLNDENTTSCLIDRGRVILARNTTGSINVSEFQPAYALATRVRMSPLPREILEPLHTTTPPTELLRGTNVIAIITEQVVEPVAKPTPEPTPAPSAAPTAAPTPTRESTPEPVEQPQQSPQYRVTLRGRDALDPMNDRSHEFRATFGADALTIIRSLWAGRDSGASDTILSDLAKAGYIYRPEDNE